MMLSLVPIGIGIPQAMASWLELVSHFVVVKLWLAWLWDRWFHHGSQILLGFNDFISEPWVNILVTWWDHSWSVQVL